MGYDLAMTASTMDMAIGALALHRFRFTLETTRRLALPPFCGSEFHGGMGMMLARHAPAVYRELFSESEHSRPRPYALRAPVLTRVSKEGEAMVLELMLVGAAGAHIYACFDALARLGETGVGKARGGFRIAEVHAIKPLGTELVFSRTNGHVAFWGSATSVAEILSASEIGPASACSVEFVTPLRLKREGVLLRSVPALDVLLLRIMSRAAQLAEVPLPAMRHSLLEIASSARIACHDIRWQEWSRYSARQGKSMPFGGLVGSVRYEGENLQPLIPWLRLAEWLHVGNKTTFGLGACRVTPHE
jgi:hypothetical protein